MNTTLNIKIGSILAILLLVFHGCIEIEHIEQPDNVQAGQILNAKIYIRIKAEKPRTNVHFVFACLIPKAWRSAKDASITYTSNKGTGTMIRIPDNVIPVGGDHESWVNAITSHLGIGENRLPEVEWVAFWTDKVYQVKANDPDIVGQINFRTKVSTRNELVKIGYFLGFDTDGFLLIKTYRYMFSKKLSVINGLGPVVNYCDSQILSVVPAEELYKGTISIVFDANAFPNSLMKMHELFFSSKAYTSDRQVIQINEKDNLSKLAPMGNNKWKITVSPMLYYKIKAGQEITRIDFFFTDKDGHQLVGSKPNHPFCYMINRLP